MMEKYNDSSSIDVSSKNGASSTRSLASITGSIRKKTLTRSNSILSSRQSQKSYNSYQLMIKQCEGIEWREKWKTRMLIMDAVRWAEDFSMKKNLPDITMTKEEMERLQEFFKQVVATNKKTMSELNNSEVLSLDDSKDDHYTLRDVVHSKESNFFDSESETMSCQDDYYHSLLPFVETTQQISQANVEDASKSPEPIVSLNLMAHILVDEMNRDHDNFVIESIPISDD